MIQKFRSDRQVLLSLLYKEGLDKSYTEYIYSTVPDSIENYDTGWLHVSDVAKSKVILKKHINDDFEYKYCPVSFLISSPSFAHDGHIKKFDFDDIKGYFKKLVEAGVVIYNFNFSNVNDHLFCQEN